MPLNDRGSQPVGLNMNPGLSITVSIVRRSVEIPATYWGSGSVVIVSCAVTGFDFDLRPHHLCCQRERADVDRHYDREAERRALIGPVR